MNKKDLELVKAGLRNFLIGKPPENSARPAARNRHTTYKPVYSNSLGVGRKQRQKLVEHLKSQGLGHVQIDAMGRPQHTSDRQRRQIAKAMHHEGMDSFY